MNHIKVLSKKRLSEVYKLIAKDGNGEVDFNEVREMFNASGSKFSEREFQLFIRQVDQDGNILISQKEFENMMLMLC